ncbi:MAG: hypothetical protein E6767_11875 [Dysgonomonas sp.]|nr:hypothetical protein [Dysgonomonas sp.]
MKKIKIKIVLIMLLMICFVGGVEAQSIRSLGNTSEAPRDIIKKIDSKTFVPVPAGVMSYKIENNKLWELVLGEIEVADPKGTCRILENRTNFYDKDNNIVGYYIKSERRFYIASGFGDQITKEESYAVLMDGILYVTAADDLPQRYSVDENIGVEIIGFYLFILS